MPRFFALIFLFTLALPTASAQADRTTAQALGITGPISESQAEAIAARHLSGTARSTHQETEDGVPVFEVVVATGEGLREATVRIADGAVLEVEDADEDDETAEGREADETEAMEHREDDEEDGETGSFSLSYTPHFDPSAFVATVTNPYYPLVPGTTRRYESRTPNGTETDVVEVLAETREVAGVTAVVVRDRGYEDGELVEETYDWYAQDAEGNVWYLGEDSREMEDGAVASTHGSWETGVDGAQAGIIMPAHPAVGQGYWQERRPGVAEDRARVIRTGEAVTLPLGRYTDCVTMEETTPLEPHAREHKTYCPGIGEVIVIENLASGEGFLLSEVTTR